MMRTLTGEIPLMSREAELDQILAKLRGPHPPRSCWPGR
jgi:hypothetical protein